MCRGIYEGELYFITFNQIGQQCSNLPVHQHRTGRRNSLSYAPTMNLPCTSMEPTRPGHKEVLGTPVRWLQAIG